MITHRTLAVPNNLCGRTYSYKDLLSLLLITGIQFERCYSLSHHCDESVIPYSSQYVCIKVYFYNKWHIKEGRLN